MTLRRPLFVPIIILVTNILFWDLVEVLRPRVFYRTSGAQYGSGGLNVCMHLAGFFSVVLAFTNTYFFLFWLSIVAITGAYFASAMHDGFFTSCLDDSDDSQGFSLNSPSPTRVVRTSSAAGPSSAVAPIFVDFAAGFSWGADNASSGRSPASLFPFYFTSSRLYAGVILFGLLPDSMGGSGAPGTATRSRQYVVARSQRDAALQALASVPSELRRVRDESNGLCSALAVLHGPLYESRSSS